VLVLCLFGIGDVWLTLLFLDLYVREQTSSLSALLSSSLQKKYKYFPSIKHRRFVKQLQEIRLNEDLLLKI
jgi:hypothetical protein